MCCKAVYYTKYGVWTAAQLQHVSNILIRTAGVLHLELLKNTYNVLELKNNLTLNSENILYSYLSILMENEHPLHYHTSLLMIDDKSLQIYNMNY